MLDRSWAVNAARRDIAIAKAIPASSRAMPHAARPAALSFVSRMMDSRMSCFAPRKPKGWFLM
nr:hypothetical protein [Candidatus Sigynarchaeota archaeon]